MNALFRKFVDFEAHHRVAVSLGVGVLTAVLAFQVFHVRPLVGIILAWDAFALSSLLLAWVGILFSDTQTRVREAKLQDSSRTAIAFSVVLASVASLYAVWMMLRSGKDASEAESGRQVVLAVGTVLVSWLLVHTVFSLHYTHLCYGLAEGGRNACVGVDFPCETEPDFLDFAYFSFVIGMTCQVSDVQITSRPVRRLALFHGLLAFAFNTIILALSINVVASLVTGGK